MRVPHSDDKSPSPQGEKGIASLWANKHERAESVSVKEKGENDVLFDQASIRLHLQDSTAGLRDDLKALSIPT